MNRHDLLVRHDNEYGFSPNKILKKSLDTMHYPSVSAIIPYYNTGDIFSRCLYYLYRAIDKYPGQVEVVIVDDGSEYKPVRNYIESGYLNRSINIITHEKNMGRTAARNSGLMHATGEVVFFLDSDVLIDETVLINNIKLHLMCMNQGLSGISVNFFEFTDKADTRQLLESLKPKDLSINDFRLDCVYGKTWIGCDDDKQYIGQRIRLLNETDNFRKWHGQYKAWMLPNMVLGGAFSVLRREINAIGGFDNRFKGYGFTETSAVTRMVAERGNVVIPNVIGGGLHLEDEETNLSRNEKDIIFKEKHDFYYNTFLKEEIK